jgi:hypothetical protein
VYGKEKEKEKLKTFYVKGEIASSCWNIPRLPPLVFCDRSIIKIKTSEWLETRAAGF